jgi:hypothetical protein
MQGWELFGCFYKLETYKMLTTSYAALNSRQQSMMIYLL